jgi:nucleoside-diphosphate-sugar epimerase
LSNLYGKYFSNQIYLLPTLLRESKKNKEISININKNSKKNYISVNDVIPLIMKIINKGKYRIYNIASNKLYSLKFIAKCIKKNTNCKINYKNQNIKYDEPKININRIKKEFSFSPKDNFKKFLNQRILVVPPHGFEPRTY